MPISAASSLTIPIEELDDIPSLQFESMPGSPESDTSTWPDIPLEDDFQPAGSVGTSLSFKNGEAVALLERLETMRISSTTLLRSGRKIAHKLSSASPQLRNRIEAEIDSIDAQIHSLRLLTSSESTSVRQSQVPVRSATVRELQKSLRISEAHAASMKAMYTIAWRRWERLRGALLDGRSTVYPPSVMRELMVDARIDGAPVVSCDMDAPTFDVSDDASMAPFIGVPTHSDFHTTSAPSIDVSVDSDTESSLTALTGQTLVDSSPAQRFEGTESTCACALPSGSNVAITLTTTAGGCATPGTRDLCGPNPGNQTIYQHALPDGSEYGLRSSIVSSLSQGAKELLSTQADRAYDIFTCARVAYERGDIVLPPHGVKYLLTSLIVFSIIGKMFQFMLHDGDVEHPIWAALGPDSV